MAAPSVTHNITRVEPFNGAAGGSFGTIGGGPGAGQAAGLQYEGTQCAQRRISSTGTDFGFTYTHGSTISFLAAGNSVWVTKTYTALTDYNSTKVRAGDTTAAYHEYTIGDTGTQDGGGKSASPAGGYLLVPINVSMTAWIDQGITGTPDVTIADVWAMTHNVNATTGAGDSQALDALDVTDDGYFLVGGDGASVDATFQDFLDADEGEGVTGMERVGLWSSKSGTFFVHGLHVIGRTDAGTVTATNFTDSVQTVVFPFSLVDAGWNGFEIDLNGTANVVVDWNLITIIGLGRRDKKVYFDTEFDVTGGATDTISITAHGMTDGQQVVYSAEGGTEDIGPDATTGQSEFVGSGGPGTGARWYVSATDADTIQLHATASDGYAATTPQGLTASAAGNGENHSLRVGPDTRPDITVSGTDADSSATWTDCTFLGFRTVTTNSRCTVTRGSFIQGQSWVHGGASISDATFNSPTTPIGEAFMTMTTSADIANISGCSFISGGEGHAIEVNTTATTVTATNVDFSGYGPDLQSFNALNDVDAANDEIDITAHGFSTGDPVYYVASDPDTGTVGTALTGLTSGNLYYVEAVTANSISLHLSEASAVLGAAGNTIAISAGSDELHQICSANAAFYNSTGGDIVINVSGGSTISIRNSSGSTTTVNAGVTTTVRGVTEGATILMRAIETVGSVTSGDTIMSGQANESGIVTANSHIYEGDIDVRTTARYSGFFISLVQDDGGVFTNKTTGGNNTTTDTMDLFVDTGVANTGDAHYFGHPEQFSGMRIDVTTAGTGSYTIDWEYWNGAWTSLSVSASTGDVDFKTASDTNLSWTIPGDWVTTSVTNDGTTTNFYWVRAVIATAATTVTPDARRAIAKDVTRYLPFTQDGTITSSGLTVQAVWIRDSIASS